MNEVALGRIFLRVLQFASVSIIPPMLHSHLHVDLTGRTPGQSLGTFHTAILFSNSGNVG